MLKLFLWLRYLRKKKIVLFSIAAVALSTALLIVITNLFSSFINAFEQSAVEVLGDIVINPPIKLPKYQRLIERLEQTEMVQAATGTLSSPGLLHLGKGNVRAVEIWGIEPEKRAEVTGFKQSLLKAKDCLVEPSFEVGGVEGKSGGFVGIGIVTKPDEKTDEYDFKQAEKMIGEQVVLTTGTIIETEAAEQRRFKRKTIQFTIADIVFTGIYEMDKMSIYLPIERLQRILYPNREDQIAGQIQIKLRDETDVDAALAQIRGLWQKFAAEELNWDSNLIRYTDIETAKKMQSRYVAEFRKQMGILLLIFGIVSLSVILLIFCIFYMIVETRQRDIAIVKSCGAASGSVASVFVGFGACVGIVGSGLGIMLGYIVTENINAIEQWISTVFGLKLWKSSVYLFTKIPNEMAWTSIGPIVFFAILAAVVGALIPAIVAARTRPVNILRYE